MGFTLAELLISLAILGVIATFTIPKILNAQRVNKYNATAKEAIAMISQAHHAYRMDKRWTVGAAGAFLSTYLPANLNYIRLETTSAVSLDIGPSGGGASVPCSSALRCYRLHSGALLMPVYISFAGTNDPGGVMSFYFDPDGQYTGEGDGLLFQVEANGRTRTYGDYVGDPSEDPSWFHW